MVLLQRSYAIIFEGRVQHFMINKNINCISCKLMEITTGRLLTANCNCSLSFVAGVDGAIPCCFKSNASKAAGFTSVDGGVVVVVT